MKKKKKKLSMSLSVLIIGFLISTSSLNMNRTKALLEGEYNQFNTDSFDGSAWKWTTTEVVSTESIGNSMFPSIAIDSQDNIHVAWDDLSGGPNYRISYKRWNATSLSWSSTEVISTESTSLAMRPYLAVDSSDNLHVVWQDMTNYAGAGGGWDIFYKRWNATSLSWTPTEVVSTESTSAGMDPSLGIDSLDNLHVVWYDYTNYAGAGTDSDIFYKKLDATSMTWTTTEVVSTESIADCFYQSITIDSSDNLHVVWDDTTDYAGAGTDRDIFYKKFDKASTTWLAAEVISSESTASSDKPSITTDSLGRLHVVWYDSTNYTNCGTDQDIFYKSWNTYSKSWTTLEVVSTESTSNSLEPDIISDSLGNIHVVWHDYTDYAGAGTDRDILYRVWDFNALSWMSIQVVSTESTDISVTPTLVSDFLNNIHVVWYDYTNYAGAGAMPDIFYKKYVSLPPSPELAFIVPNPSTTGIINLDWKELLGVTKYYIYRSSSYIWSESDISALISVSTSNYTDIINNNGIYYYAIVSENFVGNSSLSNCEYIDVEIPLISSPELSFILPNPTENSAVSLDWNDIQDATTYYVYRDTAYIWSVASRTPITSVSSSNFIDALPAEDTYYYVIIASDGSTNSSISNCEYVEYKVPHLREFSIVSGLILVAFALVFVVTRIRKKNFKLN